MNVRAVVCLLVVAACGDGNPASPDAASIDAAPAQCTAPTGTLPPGMHKIFLNTEGVTLTKGTCEDSRTNCTGLVAQDNTVVPPAFMGDPDRQLYIDQIVGFVQDRLAPFSVDVVTTRPTSGDYWMIVLGGDPLPITGHANILSVASSSCSDVNRNSISLVFTPGTGAAPRKDYATSILSDFGALVGMAVTNVSGDCMCRVDGCDFGGMLCTYGTMAAVSEMQCGRSTQDEPAILQAVLGCR